MDLLKTLRGAALSISLCLAVPAAAQFEIEYPDEPPKEGQTLLDWANPPLLRYTIPENERGDLSACDAASEFDLQEAAVTCWPLLRPLQLYTLAEYSAQETLGDRDANVRKSIEYADQAIAFIGEPEWPLEEFLRTKALARKVTSLIRLEEWDAALPASRLLIANIESDLFEYDQFRLAYAQRDYSRILLKLGMVDEARGNLENARNLLTGFDGDKVGWPFSNHSEDIAVHAILRGDLAYAESVIDLYLEHLLGAPRGMKFGDTDHIDLKLYFVAARGDRHQVLSLLGRRFSGEADYNPCRARRYRFPLMLAPLRSDPEIIDALTKGGCSPAIQSRLNAVPDSGIRTRYNDVVLPYIPLAGE